MALDVVDITDDLLDAFEEALLSPNPVHVEEASLSPRSVQVKAPLSSVQEAWPLLGQGLVHWPLEIRRSIAGYLQWRELIHDVRLCRSWRCLGQDVPLWWIFFVGTWPQHARRQAERIRGPQDWHLLFRKRWKLGGKDGDATEEDWLDFHAAQEEMKAREAQRRARLGLPSAELASRSLQRDLTQCRDEVLQTKGVQVPIEADARHTCNRYCCFHRLPNRSDTFVCESSGQLHQCRKDQPCQICVVSEDDCYLVCPASGLTFETLNLKHEEAVDDANVWDPAMSEGQQMRSWFEQGYGMSEDQACTFFRE